MNQLFPNLLFNNLLFFINHNNSIGVIIYILSTSYLCVVIYVVVFFKLKYYIGTAFVI